MVHLKKIFMVLLISSSLLATTKNQSNYIDKNNSPFLINSDKSQNLAKGDEIKKQKVAYYNKNDSKFRESKHPCDNVASYLNFSRINTCGSKTWNIKSSFLFWYCREENLDAAKIVTQNNFLVQTDSPIYKNNNASFLKTPFEYHPAFKVGIGMNSCHDAWNINIDYFRYNIDLHNSFSFPPLVSNRPNKYYVNPYWIPDQFLGVNWTEASNKWHLTTNIIDFELDRESYFGKCLRLRPYIGFRSGTIDQKYKANYISIDETFPAVSTYDSSNKSDSWLLGPRGGLQTKWHLLKYLNFNANSAISLFYQKLVAKAKNITTTNENDNIFNPMLFMTKKKVNQISASFEANLELETGSYFCQKKYYASFAASYDWTLYLHQNWMRTLINQAGMPFGAIVFNELRNSNTASISDASPGNLMFHGWTFSARLDF